MTYPTAKVVKISLKQKLFEAVEYQRQQIIHFRELPDFSGTDEDDLHRFSSFRLIFGHDLTARTAWSSRGRAYFPALFPGNRHAFHDCIRVLGMGIEHCRPFGAEA